MNGELIAPMTYEETMTSDFFEAWFQKFLLPTLTAPLVIILKRSKNRTVKSNSNNVLEVEVYYSSFNLLY
ncbi:DDE_3 domain protein [Streptococcus pneumoniae]|nr:DDE_3 domain protein [Streptococcus pneumoniae]